MDGAIAAMRDLEPDVVFLDIHLRGRWGFEIFDEDLPECEVIFVTAYDEYALRVFELEPGRTRREGRATLFPHGVGAGHVPG